MAACQPAGPGAALLRVQARLSCEESRAEMQALVDGAAEVFVFTPEQLAAEGGDGYDHPHEWFELHRAVADALERQLGAALVAEGVGRDEFLAEAREALAAHGRAQTVSGSFLALLADSADYGRFVALMKMRQRLAASVRDLGPPPPPEEGSEDGGEEEESEDGAEAQEGTAPT